MIRIKSMNNKHQEKGVLTGPLIFTLPAASFIVILNFDWLEGTNPITASAKTHGSDYLATRLLPSMQEILPQVVRRQIVLNPRRRQ
jgi:hypothetical protein